METQIIISLHYILKHHNFFQKNIWSRKKENATSFYDLFYYFVIYAILGWIFEAAFAYVKQNEFVNRGFLYGPFCPIYGFGMVGIYLIVEGTTHIFYSSSHAPLVIVFLITTFWTTIIEGVTGAVMHHIFHVKWWDYTDRPLNIKGYVCLEFSIIWGIFGTIIIKYFHVGVIRVIELIPKPLGIIVLVLLSVYFIFDLIITIHALVRFRKLLLELESTSQEYILSKCKLIDEVQNIKKNQDESNKINSLNKGEEILDIKSDFDFGTIQNRYDKMSNQLFNSRLYKAFPHMKSTRFHNHFKYIR